MMIHNDADNFNRTFNDDSDSEVRIMRVLVTGTDVGGAINCTECPSGYIAMKNADRCTICPAGTEPNAKSKKS